ncbi:family 43 glycosylhydrolase [Saccharicrinis sp. FJH62]|uniref:glycoside hydrolase family 43 protein n=1 Tax=Saccharicrinis sp. FJH62 TaxID=3344657 RepID=UPI0035D50089
MKIAGCNFKHLLKTYAVWITIVILAVSCASKKDKTSERDQVYFTNPIFDEGPDPFVYLHSDGFYYCMVTRGDRLTLWKTNNFTQLRTAESKDIWFPPEAGPNSCCIWAPEIHYINDEWYVYYSACDANNAGDHSRYVFVLHNKSTDPMVDSWEDLGKIDTEFPGIDGNVFHYKNDLYFMYSPYIGNQSGIMIAKMKSPVEIETPATLLGLPLHDWEKTGDREIMEGPQFLEGPEDKIFIIYSAGACWDDNYGLGLLSADKDANLLDSSSWSRSDHQVFEQCQDSSVFGPGHNCFTKSPDGKDDWIVYHAKAASSDQCAGRSTRAQKFTWFKGEPKFGKPYSTKTKLSFP